MEPRDIGNYIVYPDGRVWSKYKKAFMKPGIDKNGYYKTVIDGKGLRIHRLIAETFIPNPLDLTHIDHRNNEQLDNRVENLQWITHGDNVRKAYKDGLVPILKGIQIGGAKLTEDEAHAIKYNHPNLGHAEVARMYNCDRHTAQRIRVGRTWKHI
jgi:hypothetical protein